MMFGWLPLTLKLFQVMSHRRAAFTTLILAWMFLPQYAYSLPGLPDWDKTAAASFSVLIATFVFARSHLESFQWEMQDFIVAFFCLTPMFASLTNGLGAYDGVAASKNYVTTWFVPYFLGRIYLTDWSAVRDLAWGIFYGGLIYVPLCWMEITLSPQLHMWVYGWHPHDFIQSVRGNSFRPVIFMHHGLMVGMWMAAAVLCGFLLWKQNLLDEMKPVLKRFHVPGFVRPSWVFAFLAVTFVACQSFGALILVVQAVVVLVICLKWKTKLPLLLLLLLPVSQMTSKIVKEGEYSREKVEFIAKISEDRAASLEFRLINDAMLVKKAMERPVFGWGGWGRSRVRDHTGEDISVTDAYWVILLGTTGLVGLGTFTAVVLLPVWRVLMRFEKRTWDNPAALLVLPMLVLLPLYFQDCLLNDMKNPIYMVIAGGLISLVRVPALFRAPASLPAIQPADLTQSAAQSAAQSEGHATPAIPSPAALETRYV